MNNEPRIVSYANSLRLQSRQEEAIQILTAYNSRTSLDADAWLVLGLCYMNTSRLVIAIGYFHKALKLCPYPGNIYYLIAFCIHKYTEYDGSLKYFRRSPYYGCDHPDLWLWYGEALMRTNQNKQALAALSRAAAGKVCDPNRLYSFLFRSAERIRFPCYSKQGYHEAIVNRLKKRLKVTNIVCVGDSHVLLLEHINSLRVIQTGSPTAYNLLNPDSTESGLQKIMQAVSELDPSSTAILFTYAEIDIRNHIHKHSFYSGRNFADVSSDVVIRYVEVLNLFANQGYTLLVNGPFGSGAGVPNHGSEKDRNTIAYYIDRFLREAAAKLPKAYYASLIDLVVDNEFQTDRAFVGEVDDNHLDKSPELSFLLLARFLEDVNRYLDLKLRRPEKISMSILGNVTLFAFFSDGRPSQPIHVGSNGYINSHQKTLTRRILVSVQGHELIESLTLQLNSSHSTCKLQCICRLYDGDMTELFCSDPLSVADNLDIPTYRLSLYRPQHLSWYVSFEFTTDIPVSALYALQIQATRYTCFV